MNTFEKFMELEIEDAKDDIRRKGTRSVVTTNYRRGYLEGLQQALNNYLWFERTNQIKER